MTANKRPVRKTLPHEIPPWVPEGARYFITIVTKDRQTNPFSNPGIADSVLNSIRSYDESGKWYIWLAVVMPDHIHLIANFPSTPGLLKTVQMWKGFLVKRLGLKFQDGFFEHRLRNEDEFLEKMNYVRNNPVTRQLVQKCEEYPYFHAHTR